MYFAIVLSVIFILDILLLLEVDVKEVKDEKKLEEKGNASEVKLMLPAIDNEGRGVPTFLFVKAVEGEGKTLTDIENILFFADTQHSIRIARMVAENITQVNCSKYDLIYSIKANASVIGGPSAGSAITIGTISALTGKQPNKSVMITGTINHDGSIGPVSSILEKARASKKAGAELFLVPLLQSREVVYEVKKHCEEFGFSEVCWEEKVPKKVNVGEEAGIDVREVESIEEAEEYFF